MQRRMTRNVGRKAHWFTHVGVWATGVVSLLGALRIGWALWMRDVRDREADNLVDIAARDSFPASDPPSFAGARSEPD